MDVKHQLVVDAIGAYSIFGMVWNDWNDMPTEWTADDVDERIDYLIDDLSDEYYTEDVYPIIATKNIRKTLDLELIAKELEEIAWKEFTEILFDSDW